MTALSLSEAPGATGVAKITITGALKSRWHAATRKQNGGYEIDTVVPASSERRVRSLLPWRRAAEARADAELGNSSPWPSSSWRTSRPRSTTCGRSATPGRRWRRRAYGRRRNRPRHDGRGSARPHDGGGPLAGACRHADNSASSWSLLLRRVRPSFGAPGLTRESIFFARSHCEEWMDCRTRVYTSRISLAIDEPTASQPAGDACGSAPADHPPGMTCDGAGPSPATATAWNRAGCWQAASVSSSVQRSSNFIELTRHLIR